MAQFDVFRAVDGTLLIDCQSDALNILTTRLAAPLMPFDQAPARRPRLNPVFDVAGEPHVMVTQFAAAIDARELQAKVANLTASRLDVIGAFDMLLTGV